MIELKRHQASGTGPSVAVETDGRHHRMIVKPYSAGNDAKEQVIPFPSVESLLEAYHQYAKAWGDK